MTSDVVEAACLLVCKCELVQVVKTTVIITFLLSFVATYQE